MITGVRKAGEITSTPQRTKTHKVNNEEDELMEAENKSDSEMIKEMWSMMKSMKTKTEQACESAEKATQAAEKAATEAQEVKESITGISLNIKELRRTWQRSKHDWGWEVAKHQQKQWKTCIQKHAGSWK